jgi:chemotaxis protein MotB
MALPADDPPPGVPEWVVTYGDMMSLLLTFFIMLVSMSEVKQDGRLRRMMDSLRQQFGPTNGEFGSPGQAFSTTGSMPELVSAGDTSEGDTKRASVDSAGLAGPSRTVKRIGHGSQITLGGPALFTQFDAELNDAAKADLQIIAKAVGPRPNRVVVRGHATRELLPDGSPYRDAWDLAFARAQAGANHLIELGIAPERVAVASAGDSEPRTVSRDPEQQRLNRRIDVFVIDAYTTPPGGGGSPRPGHD